jgi:hypothetical protein
MTRTRSIPLDHHGRVLGSFSTMYFARGAAIERGIVAAGAVLRTTVELARQRRAVPLIVVPHIGREEGIRANAAAPDPRQGRLPYLSVGLDPSWRRRGDLHRHACPARAIAASMPP